MCQIWIVIFLRFLSLRPETWALVEAEGREAACHRLGIHTLPHLLYGAYISERIYTSIPATYPTFNLLSPLHLFARANSAGTHGDSSAV